MKSLSPRQITLIISLIATFILSAVSVILFQNDLEQVYLQLIFLILISFLIIYIVVYYLIVKYVIDKIKPIYKTIHNLKISDDKLWENIDNKNIISETNKEVLIWAKKKTNEIAQLKQLAKYRKEFLGNVSHELKTPIFNIQGYVLTLLDGGLEDPSVNRRYLEKTEKSINRMIALVEDLDAISKLEAGVLKLNMENFDLLKLIKEIFEEQELNAKKKGIKLILHANSDKSVFVFADRKRIHQCITNLIINSINYGKDYGHTEIAFLDMDENIMIEVSDDGIGISEEDIPRIFERFYRVDKSRSRAQGGTGLGLAIVKHVIEAHNQAINVRSSEKEGTSFTFTLKKGQKG